MLGAALGSCSMDDLDRRLRDAGAQWRTTQPPSPEVDSEALANAGRMTFAWQLIATAGTLAAAAIVILVFSLGPRTGTGGPATSPTDSPAPIGTEVPASCVAAANDTNGTVAASFRSTIGAIRQLPAVADNPQLASYADSAAATVCYVDGQIPKGPPLPASGTIPPSFDRTVLVVVGGQTYVISAGYSQDMPIHEP
jgi:hypothetical protein